MNKQLQSAVDCELSKIFRGHKFGPVKQLSPQEAQAVCEICGCTYLINVDPERSRGCDSWCVGAEQKNIVGYYADCYKSWMRAYRDIKSTGNVRQYGFIPGFSTQKALQYCLRTALEQNVRMNVLRTKQGFEEYHQNTFGGFEEGFDLTGERLSLFRLDSSKE